MKRWGLMLGLLCWGALAYSQNLLTSMHHAAEGIVYRIDVNTARAFASQELRYLPEKILTDPVQKFPGQKELPESLLPGHYVATQVKGNQLEWKYLQVANCSVMAENDARHLMLKVVDSEGQVVNDAIVKVGDMLLPFDPTTQTYKAKLRKKPYLAEVEVDGLVQFFQVTPRTGWEDDEILHPKPLRRYLWNPVQNWIIKPVVLTMRLPYDVVASAVKLRPYGWLSWLVVRSKQVAHLASRVMGEHKLPSMAVCSQPRYRPGDTVQVKALLTKQDGSPVRGRLGMYVRDRSYVQHQVGTLRSLGRGAYAGEFVLHDSLNLLLDRDTEVQFWRMQGKRQVESVGMVEFHYEDYELNAFTLHLRMAAATHWLGKEAVAFVEAKDMNGLTVPDARARISVLSSTLNQWVGERLFIPDTLWTWQGNLDPAGETRIAIPQDKMPPAALQYQVVAECWSSDNERKSQTTTVNYLHDIGELKLEQRGSTLQVSYLRQDQSIPQAAKLTISTGERMQRPPMEVMLPLSLPLSPAWSMVSVECGPLASKWVPQGGVADLQVVGQHTGDSLLLQAASRLGLPFSWHLFANDQEISQGQGPLLLRMPAKARTTYHLNVHGSFGGDSFSEDYDYNCPENILKVEMNAPQTIYPGMVADVKLHVQDRKGRPVRDADLTAYAVNGRFEGQGGPELSIRARPTHKRHHKVFFETNRPDHLQFGHGSHLLDYYKWVDRARLDTLPWYDFLYPMHRIYTYRHPIDPDRAELAPFVVRDGAIQPVQIVYIDGEPVYFAWSTPHTPYSFPTQPGVAHLVEIRLTDATVILDSVRTPLGYKTILSVDRAKAPSQMHVKAMPSKVQPMEQSIINQRTFAYRYPQTGFPATISFGTDRTFRLTGGVGNLCGPAKMNGEMSLSVLDQYNHRITYEPNFEYDFDAKTVKMRTWDNARMPQKFNFYTTATVDERAWREDSILAAYRREQARAQRAPRLSWINFNGSNYGRVILSSAAVQPPLKYPKALLVYDTRRQEVYRVRTDVGSELRLPVGQWAAYLQLDSAQFVPVDSVLIQPKGRNHLRMAYDPADIQDTIPAQLVEIMRKSWDWSSAPSEYRNTHFFRDSNRPRSGRTVTLEGWVTDESTGEPLPAAMVYCVGFGVGCMTDFEGRFEMQVPVETDSIVVHVLGYADKYLPWHGEHGLDIRVSNYNINIETVVITESRMSTDIASLSASMDVIAVSKIEPVVSIRGGRAAPVVTIIDGQPNIGGPSNIDGKTVKSQLQPAFPQELLADLAGTAVMRSHFRDHAFWAPDLRTDRAGDQSIRVHFPEDITRWDAYAVAVDRRGRAGLAEAAIKAWKPLAGRLALPRFLMAGDTCLAIGKVLNYTGDTVALQRKFVVGDRTETHAGDCGPFVLDTLRLVAPSGVDSLTVSYQALGSDGYGDGEQLGIGVYPVGIVDALGVQASLAGDTVLRVPTFAPDGGPVKVFATTHFQQLLLVESKRMHDYHHLCNEQLSSKLIALLSEEIIFKSLDRPWHSQKDVAAVVRLLVKRIAPMDQGLAWGWWPGMRPELWVSLHVTRALLMARAQGYQVPLQTIGWEPGLLNRLDWHRGAAGNIEVLQLLQLASPGLNIVSQVKALDTLQLHSVTQQVEIMELRQKVGLPIDLDSLDRLMNRAVLGNPAYQSDLRTQYSNHYRASQPVYCPLQAVLGAYRIKRAAGQSAAQRLPLLMAILDSRKLFGWSNTYETALALQTLVPDIGAKAFTEKPKTQLVIDGRKQALPMDSVLEIKQVPQALSVEKSGSGIVFFSATQRFFNPQPTPADSLFAIQTTFLVGHEKLTSDRLRAGEPLTMRVQLTVKRAMDYLLVDIPIPAGCSYGAKTPGYGYAGNYGCYREYFRNKVSCYYRQLAEGEYVIDIPLQPRYSGSYVLNCARVEQMYMPLLCGQNAVRRVHIQ